MTPVELFGIDVVGLVFVLFSAGLIFAFLVFGRRSKTLLREIPAFTRLRRAIGIAVETGERLHVSLGWGSLSDLPAGSSFVGFTILQRLGRTASVSDRPPVATSGEGSLALLSQESLRSTYSSIGEEAVYDPAAGRLTGLTPFSYAAGTLPVIFDEDVSANIMAGHFGSEVALLADAGERSGSLTIGGSDSLPAQAVLFVAAQEALIGEELYASGAYLRAGTTHLASLRAQDFLRWVVIAVILAGAVLKVAGVL